jgi:hypothetical protein
MRAVDAHDAGVLHTRRRHGRADYVKLGIGVLISGVAAYLIFMTT